MSRLRLTPFFVFALLLGVTQTKAQRMIAQAGVNYFENFDTLATTGTSAVMPVGWLFFENGGTSTTTYAADIGTSTSGNTFSYGLSASTNRALGSIASGTTQPMIGARFVNTTGTLLTSATITCTLEQWRAGGRTTADSTVFAYGLNNAALQTGTWNTDHNLTFTSKVLGGTGRALNGNDTANQRFYNYTIVGLAVQPNDTFCIRWSDINAAGSDDGLAVDSFTIAFYASGTGLVAPPASLQLTISNQTSGVVSWNKPSGYVDSLYTTLVFAKASSAINSGIPSGNPSKYIADSNFTSTSSSRYQHDSSARCIMNGDLTSVSLLQLNPNTNYHISAFVVRLADSTYSSAAQTNATTFSFTPPSPLQSITVSPKYVKTADISWVLPTSYNSSTQQVLLFAKADTSQISGTATKGFSQYAASTNFGSGSRFELDTNAFCIYNGDLTSMTLNNLQFNQPYQLLGYVVSQFDSLYATAVVVNFTQNMAPPASVNNLTITGTSGNTARISWTKPTSYTNNTYTTLVFMKADSALNNGIPTRAPSAYFGTGNFGLGSPYQHDNKGYCVYKGDTNFVNITNISNSKNYFVSVMIVEDYDSVYSSITSATGSALPPPPYFPIGNINTVNPVTGVPDSLNKYVMLKGIVYGFNQRTFGLQFLLRDATGGIQVFSNSRNYSYTVKEGDSIAVSGVISHNRGQIQITSLDTVELINSGNRLPQPIVVNTLNENTENQLVRVNLVRFVSTPAGSNWPTGSSNIRVIKVGTSDTLTIRLINTSGLAGKPLPATTQFSVIGMGTQTSSSTSVPFAFDGYAIIPRSASDIIRFDSLGIFPLVSPANASNVSIDTASILFTWNTAPTATGVGTPTYTWKLDTVNGNFSNPVLSFTSNSSGNDTNFTFSNQAIQNLFASKGISKGQSFYGKWMIQAVSGTFKSNSSDTFSITLTNNLQTGISAATKHIDFMMYPNPTAGQVNLISEQAIESLVMYDMNGRVVHKALFNKNNLTLDLKWLNKGIYLIEIKTQAGTGTKRLMLN